MLTLGWWRQEYLPATQLLPAVLIVEASAVQDTSEDVNPRSNGCKQRRLVQSKIPEVVLQLLQEAYKEGIPAKHVLSDLWIYSPALLHQIHKLSYDVIVHV